MPTKRWEIAEKISLEAAESLRGQSPILRQILFNRNIRTPEEAADYLSAISPSGSEPMSLTGIRPAVERIAAAILRGEQITVYGDYDADGVTATALMMETLQAMGANARAYIPNRFTEGYGLNIEALDEIGASGSRVVITVDCGIRALPEADHAQNIGLDLIVTDHHSLGPELPAAFAVINPKQDEHFSSQNLAGVGVAYKVASALAAHLKPTNFDVESLLDFVAIGTVADLVPLVGENRHLVRAGLKELRKPKRQGLFSLMQLTGLQPAKLQASNIGFGIGPRLNAAGRLDTAMAAYELLTTDDVMEAGRLAQRLDNHNRERRRIMKEMQKLAEQIAIPGDQVPYLIFAKDPRFNPGVVGLTASRLSEQYYRPAIVAEFGEEHTRGSCRSIPEFHITDALQSCADLLLHFGGHAAAAGFTVANENLAEFSARMEEQAAAQLADKDLRPLLKADAEIELGMLTRELVVELEKLQPTGFGNPEPAFVSRGVQVVGARTVGRDQSHLKLTVSDGRHFLDAIAFGLGYWMENIPPLVDLLYHFELNEFQGRESLQLNVKDLKPA